MNQIIRILYVDDYPIDREIIRDALERKSINFRVTEVTSRREFEERLREGDYDLVLSDFNILGFEGLDVIDAVCTEDPQIPVIIFTSTGSEEIAVQAMKRGAADYVIKTPEYIDTLSHTIHAAIEKKRIENEQTRAIEVLRENEELLRQSQEFSHMVAWNWNLIDDTVQWLGNVESILGHSEQEISHGKDFYNLIHPKDIAKARALFQECMDTTNNYSTEYRIIWPDETVRWLMGKGNILRKANGQATNIIGFSMDITGRKHSEKLLQEEKAYTESIVKSVPDMLFTVNIDEKIRYVNDALGKFIGAELMNIVSMSLDQIIQKYMLFIPETTYIMLKRIRMLLRNGEPLIDEEVELINDKGEIVPCIYSASGIRDYNGELIGEVVIIHDISESTRIRDELRESEQKYRTILENIEEGYFEADLKGNIIFVNNAMCRILGYSMDELLNINILGILSSEVADDIYRKFNRIYETGSPEKTMSYEIVSKDGRLKSLECSASLKRDRLERTIGFRGIARDITARKQAEKELLKYREHLEELVNERTKELEYAQERLIASERLAVLGQFAGGISHEIRNPLGVIDSSVYYLKKKLKDLDPKLTKHLDRIQEQVKRSTTIIGSLLDLTRKEEPSLKPVDIRKIASDAVSESKLPESIEVLWHMPDEKMFINGDREQLLMTFKNIIKNAIEAMDEKGTIIIHIDIRNKSNLIEITFEDTGPGIALENLTKIFEPLFSTKTIGIGFGLSICQKIIEKHGGIIKAESGPGKGAKFIISLPL